MPALRKEERILTPFAFPFAFQISPFFRFSLYYTSQTFKEKGQSKI
jgi:hypothetical protein